MYSKRQKQILPVKHFSLFVRGFLAYLFCGTSIWHFSSSYALTSWKTVASPYFAGATECRLNGPFGTVPGFEICSWLVNRCKSDMTPEEFVALSRKIVAFRSRTLPTGVSD
jgi:hypothetical protein